MNFFTLLRAGTRIAAVAACLCLVASAQNYKVMWDFSTDTRPFHGDEPSGGLVFGPHGHLYGTTLSGGDADQYGYCYENQTCGIAYELVPESGGTWLANTIYDFRPSFGGWPSGSLAVDRSGNLYGVTDWPELRNIFQLINSSGVWSANAIYAGTAFPPTFSPSGQLFSSDIAFFTLLPTTPTRWSKVILNNAGGSSSIAYDSSGNAYSTSSFGTGQYQLGAVYELTPNRGRAGWQSKIIYSFRGDTDGYAPVSGVAVDAQGNVYGTTEYGGIQNCSGGCGTLYQLKPNPDGTWTETIIDAFDGGTSDGWSPSGVPTVDAAGNVYVSTIYGGPADDGYVFKFSPTGNGQWAKTILHVFMGGRDGANPNDGLILDNAGNIFGTTFGIPGTLIPGDGLVFEITP